MRRHGYAQEIASVLYKQGTLKKIDATALARDFRDSGQAQVHEFLLEEDVVSRGDLLRALAQYYGVPAIDVPGTQFSHDLVRMFPVHVLVKNTVIPLEMDANVIVFVAARPSDTLRKELRHYTDCHVEFAVGIAKDIVEAIELFHDETPEEVAEEDKVSALASSDIVDVV